VTDEPTGASVARRRLGEELRKLREACGMTVDFAANEIERARQTLWKMEVGKPGVRILNKDVKALGTLYGAPKELVYGLLGMAEVTRVKGWAQSFADILPPNFDMYIGLEESASKLCWYEPELIPGLMQTAEYARELIQVPDLGSPARDEAEIERRLEVRLRRQQVLTRDKPEPASLHVVLNEAVVRRPIGGPEVMAAQLRHVNDLGKLPNVSVRILPFTAGMHTGLISGPFVLATFLVGDPVVYVDLFTGSQFLDKARQIDRYDFVFTEIRKRTLNERASRALISQAEKEFSRG
jgi:Domain of unknown function (DUF5753)/Helix-turn-helix domain